MSRIEPIGSAARSPVTPAAQAEARPGYGALLLDLDGTLLDGGGRVRPRNRAAVFALHERGVPVMVVTGRSMISTLPVLEELGLPTLAVIFNGGSVYCPARKRLIEERVLSNRTFRRALEYSRDSELMTVVMRSDVKLALEPRDEGERSALTMLQGLRFVRTVEELTAEYVHRVTWLSSRHASSDEFAREVEDFVAQPAYMTHFPLSVLAEHRASTLHVVDLHAPSRGKAEALRVLEEHYGVPAARAVAVGDASNDVPMLLAAGLGVAMAGGMREALEAADRVIGSHDGDAIAELIEELFP